MDTLLEVLKWIIIVLLAGSIGQFGKTMSLHIVNYFKKRKKKGVYIKSGVTNESQTTLTGSPETSEKKVEVIPPSKDEKDKQQLKVDKKALKDQLKARKKAEK